MQANGQLLTIGDHVVTHAVGGVVDSRLVLFRTFPTFLRGRDLLVEKIDG